MKKPDGIRLKGDRDAEFERIRDRIDLEANKAKDNFDLLKGLFESRTDYCLEMNESDRFWHLVFMALKDAVLSHLCRLYDRDTAALSLGRFLLTVKSNPDLFSDAAFRKRLTDNPRVDALAKSREIDGAELDRELASVSDSDPLVSRLLVLRNEAISHTAAEIVRKDSQQAWLPPQEIELLLSRASAITSKYSLLYRASLYGGIEGADDYKNTLSLLRKGLSSHQAEVEREIELSLKWMPR